MNSMSKGYYESCGKEKRREEETCQALVKCGCPSSVQVPALAEAGSTVLTLSTLTLDTSCFCDPNIKLDFTSNIVAGVAFAGTINFQIYKQCRGQLTPVPVGPAWQSGALAISSTTFSFFVCDSDSCLDECCTYTVVATVSSPAALALGVSINNATLAATVTCKNPCPRCRK